MKHRPLARTAPSPRSAAAPEPGPEERDDVTPAPEAEPALAPCPWPPYLTTVDATRYCGFKTTGALRKAAYEGRIVPAGRRGGSGTWMWRREDLDAVLCGRTLSGGASSASPPRRSEEHT